MIKRKSRKKQNPERHHIQDRPTLDPREQLRLAFLALLVALYVATPLIPGESAAERGTGIPLVMLNLLLVLAWLVTGLLSGRIEGRWGATDLALCALVGWHSISSLVMAGQGSPRPAYNMLWEWSSLGCGFLLLRSLVRSAVECRAVCAVMLGLAVCLSMFGYCQYFVTYPELRAEYRAGTEQDRYQMRYDSGVYAPRGSLAADRFEQRLESTEPVATFGLTNSLACYLATWLIVATGIAFTAVTEARFQRRTWLAIGLSVLLIAGCLLLTKSRTAYVATTLGVVLVLLYCRPGRWRLDWKIPLAAAALLTLMMLAAVLLGGVDVEVVSEAPKSLLYRFEYWQSTARMIADHPWFGCGPGNFQDYYVAYKLPQASEEIRDPHNVFFEVCATAGVPALVALLSLLGCFVWQLARRGIRLSKPDRRPPREATESDEKHASSKTAFVFAGAGLGIVIAAPLSLIAGFPLDGFPLLFGLPMAALFLWLLWPWVIHGPLPTGLLPVAVVVMLVNMMAAGGIGFPGVSGSMWLLMALALTLNEMERSTTVLPRAAGPLVGTIVLGLVIACYFTAYAPVLGGTDPHSSDQYRMQATAFHETWIQGPVPKRHAPFEEAVRQMLRLNQRSYGSQRQVGIWYLQAFERSGQPDHGQAAVKALRRTAELYPNSSIIRAELAWTLHFAGNSAEASIQGQAALRLDDVMPHDELRLVNRNLFDEWPIDAQRPDGPWGLRTRHARAWMEHLVKQK